MDIHHLKIFVTVYKHRSFTKASELVHISQPTISEHIKNLEADLGFKLFDRLSRTIFPTIEADNLYPRAMQLLDDFEKLREDMIKPDKELSGKILIGASTIPGSYLVPFSVVDFKKEYPGVSFEIIIGDSKKITDLVLGHDLLYGIVGAKMVAEKLDYIPWIEDELVLVSSDVSEQKNTLSINKITEIPILLREAGSGTRKIMEKILGGKGIDIAKMNIVATLGSTSSLKEAVKAGLGYSIISRLAIRDEIKSGLLYEIPIQGLKMNRNFYLIKHKKRSLPKSYLVFYDYLKKFKKSYAV